MAATAASTSTAAAAAASADVKAAAPAPAPAPAPTASAAAGNHLFDAFDAQPFGAGVWPGDSYMFGGAWPFASAATQVPALMPSFGSFAFPSFPPLPALHVPVWSASHSVAAPAIALDLIELPDRFVAVADLPGVHTGDIDIRVDRDARVVNVAVVRRRTANCDCNFVQSCGTANTTPTKTATGSASAGTKAAAADAKGKCECACDGKCKAKAVHCRDCEAKGELMGPAAPTTPLVNGCCGFCPGALHVTSGRCGRGKACATAGGVYRRSERQFGRGERTFRVPSDADLSAVSSSLRGGVLTITVPRATAKATPTTAADVKADAQAHTRYETTGHVAAAVAADPKARAQVLTHHVTAPDANPTVTHERVMRQAVSVAADAQRRAALLHHHMSRADPLSAYPYHSPYVAYQSVLADAMALARDFEDVAHHVPRPPYDTAASNPLLRHERLMRQAVAAAEAHTAQAQLHSAAAASNQSAAVMSAMAAMRAAAAEQSANAAAASSAQLHL